jgi:pimeloyl-ACP methyl ester carboxylesterase
MSVLTTDDGTKLHYEDVGRGMPTVFVHEFAGDSRSYEPQVRHFAKRYRCIAFNARGYPPSDVPKDAERYSQERARDDKRPRIAASARPFVFETYNSALRLAQMLGNGATALSTVLSACAEMVRVGLAASAPGITEPSTM